MAGDAALFQGYFDTPDASRTKLRDGVYHSGDLGHVLVRDGRRHLYFDGRTDDWIRKDGENFSAAQVARLVAEHPDVALAAAQVSGGGMDRKWFPDFVRIVDEFSFTETRKILVRELKRSHFDRERLPDAPLYWRERGDTAFKPFRRQDFDELRRRFAAAEREPLLDV